MKALSLTQPWATAVALGLKQWETRSWPTGYRGKLYIHAAKGFPGWAKDFARSQPLIPALSELPLGAIVCVCEVTECRQTASLVGELSEQEREWGDYSPGRFAFKLENVRAIPRPVLARGALGLWAIQWNDGNDVLRQLRGENVA
jgi:activating signal cointegrator 1